MDKVNSQKRMGLIAGGGFVFRGQQVECAAGGDGMMAASAGSGLFGFNRTQWKDMIRVR